MTRYAVTIVPTSTGVRQACVPFNWAQYYYDTPEQANVVLEAYKKDHYRTNTIWGAFAVQTLEVRPIECRESGEAISIYFTN